MTTLLLNYAGKHCFIVGLKDEVKNIVLKNEKKCKEIKMGQKKKTRAIGRTIQMSHYLNDNYRRDRRRWEYHL